MSSVGPQALSEQTGLLYCMTGPPVYAAQGRIQDFLKGGHSQG